MRDEEPDLVARSREIVRFKEGEPRIVGTAHCPICKTDNLQAMEQDIWEGTFLQSAMMRISPGGSQLGTITTSRDRKCTHCGVDPDKIHPDVLQLLSN